MAIPPRVTPEQGHDALHRITARHRRAGDDDPVLYGDDPREILPYLRKLGSGMLLADPPDTPDASHDVLDVLTVRLWLWWEAEAVELWALEMGEKLRVPRALVGARLGLTATSQGIMDRIGRLRARLRRDRITVAVAATAAPPPPALPAGPDPVYTAAVRAAAEKLIAAADRFPRDLEKDLEDIRTGLRPWRWPPGTPPPDTLITDLRILTSDERLQDLAGDLRPLVTEVAALVWPASQREPASASG